MIVTEYFMTRTDGVVLNRTYSNAGRYVIQNETGVAYTEAIDVENAPYTYTEGDIIPVEENVSVEEKAAAYDILMGVAE